MNKRWQVSEDNVSYVLEVSPINGAKVTFDDERDLDAGQIFFRRKIGSDLSFAGADYRYFKTFESQASRRCRTLYIRLQLQCGNVWQTFWTGQFSTGSGKWDLDKCIFDVKPETVDKYTCILSKLDQKHNILKAAKVNTNVVILPSVEFLVCTFSAGLYGCSPDPTTIGYDPVVVWTPIPPIQLALLWREYLWTDCIDGVAQSPPGAGWTLETDDCATTGTAKWVREPVVSYTLGTPQFFLDGDGYPIDPDSSCQWLEVGSYDYGITPPGLVPFYLCLSDADSTPVPGTRTLESAAEFMLEQTGCELTGIRSDLFNWNAVGDAPGYVSGIDYVTGTTTTRNNLVIAQKTDVIDPAASNPATIGDLSIKELIAIFSALECFWFIDADGYFRVEHWIYFAQQQGMDITDMQAVNEPLAYKHLSNEIPRVERMTFMESSGRDFVGADLTYEGQCVKPDTENSAKEYSPGKITTDVTYIFSEPTAIAKDGFVIMATNYNGVDYDVILANGAITGNLITNAPMSTANIMRDYWTWRRFLYTGNMNGADVVFDGIRDNIEQEDVLVPLCCDMLTFDPSEYLSTRLGEKLGGLNATVDSVQHEIRSDRSTFKLRYSY